MRLAQIFAASFGVPSVDRPSRGEALLPTSWKGQPLQRRKLHPRLPVCNDPSVASCCSLTRAATRRFFAAASGLRDRRRRGTEPSILASREVYWSALNALIYLSEGSTAAASRAAPEWHSVTSSLSDESCRLWPLRYPVQCISQVLFVSWRRGHSWHVSTLAVSFERQ